MVLQERSMVTHGGSSVKSPAELRELPNHGPMLETNATWHVHHTSTKKHSVGL